MSDIAPLLLPWYAQHGRQSLPWKNPPSDYRVWVSEIMLQQTQVTTVIPYFERFMQSFDSVNSLADASQDDVLRHWAGLGYYARARNLHQAAMIMRDHYGGCLPQTLDELQDLPGIGRSTAGAILSLAQGQNAAILDGNVKRVLSRVYQVDGWSGQSATLNKLWSLAEQHTPEQETASYNQAMMDLGSMVCKLSRPDCEVCPLSSICLSYRHQTQGDYPHAKPRKSRPQRHCWMLLHHHGDQLLLEKRPPKGIWGGLWSLPELQSLDELVDWQLQNIGQGHRVNAIQENLLQHQFSHFDLSISVAMIRVSKETLNSRRSHIHDEDSLLWVERDALTNYGCPVPITKIFSQIVI